MANSVNYLSQIQTGQTIQAVHVNQFVYALTGSEAYDINISGSLTLTGSVASLNGFTGSLKGTADTGSKANNIVVTNNATTNQNYRLTYVLDSNMPSIGAATYLPLQADSGSDGSGLSYNPSTNSLTASAFNGTASWASNVVTAPTPVAIYGTSYPSGSVPAPNTLFQFLAGASKTDGSGAASVTINELTGKILGSTAFITASPTGSGVLAMSVSSIMGPIVTFQGDINTNFNFIVMYI